ncbi:MAG TPA: Ig-like domain-containing protein, partial [Myxococcaceae bacterium]
MGVDGNYTVTTANEVLNRYTPLASNVAAGATSFQVQDLADLDSPQFGPLEVGDLLMIIQMQGATIDGSDTTNFGAVTALNGAGLYELVKVASIGPGGGRTIGINTTCGGLRNNYTVEGRTQVVRVPQFASLTVGAWASVGAMEWNGSAGGIIALHVQRELTLNGLLNASGVGFRGGQMEVEAGFRSFTYRSTSSIWGAEKGEGIAGYVTDYDAFFGGRYGRGAPANGGGGGNAHNSGGGGGANGHAGSTWTGQGVMSGIFAGQDPWRLDPEYIDNGNARTTSSGGGRGGYTYSASNQDAVMVPPGDPRWGGDSRFQVGGLGGRPVANAPGARLFLGGGGGAGDGNNSESGAGGRGGGLVWVVAGTVSGTGRIVANGQNGIDTIGADTDAPGGGGAGGTVVVAAQALSGVIIDAKGGRGGNQSISTVEAQGPGGGGGGGFIAVSGGAVTGNVEGGANGTSNSAAVTEFTQNGATAGAAGELITEVEALPLCLPSDLAIMVTDGVTSVIPGSTVMYTLSVANHGPEPVGGATVTDIFPAELTGVSWTCFPAGSCGVTTGSGNINRVPLTLASGDTATFTVTATVSSTARGTLTHTATVAAPVGNMDPLLENNSAADTNALIPRADLTVALTDSPDPVMSGGAFTYTLNVNNLGPNDAESVMAVLSLPVKVSFVSATGVDWTCGHAGGVVTCARDLATLGAQPVITVVVTAPEVSGTITATALVVTTTDPVADNNTAAQSSTVVPKAPVVTPLKAFVNTRTPHFGGTAQAGSTVTVWLNGAAAGVAIADEAGVWEWIPHGSLGERRHLVEATATDEAGQVSHFSEAHVFTVDVTPPEAPEVSGPGTFIKTQRPSITGKADPGSTVTVWLDGKEEKRIVVPGEGFWGFDLDRDLDEGSYDVTATAMDMAGNVSQFSQASTFTIDLGAPDAPAVNRPGAFIDTPRPEIGGTAEPGSLVTVMLDNSVAGEVIADDTGAWKFTPDQALAARTHEVVAFATDQAGN